MDSSRTQIELEFDFWSQFELNSSTIMLVFLVLIQLEFEHRSILIPSQTYLFYVRFRIRKDRLATTVLPRCIS